MTDRLNILYLPHPDVPDTSDPERIRTLQDLLVDKHNFIIFDPDQPIAPQFAEIDFVLDIGGSVGTREMVDAAAHRCRMWQIMGTGLDHFDMDYWRSKNMPVSNCPGPFSAVALSECAMMFILMLTRRYNEVKANLEKGVMYRPMGLELDGLRLGIVGLGASGMELAQRAMSFGMKILAIDIRDIGDDEVEKYGIEFHGKPDQLDKVISECDVLSVHLHLNDETRHIIDQRRLELMKPTSYLINVARGALVDEDALLIACQEGKIAGAGIDAYGQEPLDPSWPIFKLPNVITTNHISGGTDGTWRKRCECTAENADRIAAGLEPLYRVDK